MKFKLNFFWEIEMRFYPANLMINYSDLLYKVEYSNISTNSASGKNCS